VLLTCVTHARGTQAQQQAAAVARPPRHSRGGESWDADAVVVPLPCLHAAACLLCVWRWLDGGSRQQPPVLAGGCDRCAALWQKIMCSCAPTCCGLPDKWQICGISADSPACLPGRSCPPWNREKACAPHQARLQRARMLCAICACAHAAQVPLTLSAGICGECPHVRDPWGCPLLRPLLLLGCKPCKPPWVPIAKAAAAAGLQAMQAMQATPRVCSPYGQRLPAKQKKGGERGQACATHPCAPRSYTQKPHCRRHLHELSEGHVGPG